MPLRSSKKIADVIHLLNKKVDLQDRYSVIDYNQFLSIASSDPLKVFRNVFQLFSSMIYHYIIEERDERKDDPENINYKTIDTDKLFVEGQDTPFFSDLPFANRLLRLADSFNEGTQQNKIYVFIGPHGSGKSTFLNNLLRKFELYTHSSEGMNFEVLWRLDSSKLGVTVTHEIKKALNEYYIEKGLAKHILPSTDSLEVSCPSHDHPILLIPKEHRREILGNLLTGRIKTKIFNKKEYEWVFKNNACTICTSLYQALINRLESPSEVFNMVHARRYYYDKRLGEGITVYNPGDQDPKQFINTNDEVQKELSAWFKDSNVVKYYYSRYAKTNNGVFAIMDVKGHNEKRFIDLHGLISEGVHKVDDFEENVNSMFIAVMNPEDKNSFKAIESFRDRISEINVNYILNYEAEVKIFYNAFGTQIKNKFLPGVLENFAKIIISSRMNTESAAIRDWIKDRKIYSKYCDDNMLLLKMEIYNNRIPDWLTENDYKKFDRNIRRRAINESENEGKVGFSGRESIYIFNEFYNSVRKKTQNGSTAEGLDVLITMDDIKKFFSKNIDYGKKIPNGFIDSIIRLYNYNVMQEIKESLFRQNEERVSKDIQNYLFASNYDLGEKLTSPYTNEVIDINDQFFFSIEQHLVQKGANDADRKSYRSGIAQKLAVDLQQMQADDSALTNTEVYTDLYHNYMKHLRKNSFQPFIQFPAFESAIKDYGTPKYEVYDNKVKEEVAILITNLINKFNYSLEGAIQVCLYVIINNVAENFVE
ncbi:MAG: serine protein kinase PrkA [Bacteroidetes bacterium]|nr:serine protein kinase PrkA [Bacteroidota bacterium]